MQDTGARSLGQEDSPGGGRGNPLQYSCLENPMDRGPWRSYSPRGCKVDHNLATIQHRETLGRISESTHQKPVGAPRLIFDQRGAPGRMPFWVFIATHRLSPAAATGGYSLVPGHRFSCSAVCGIFPDRGWTLCPLN